MTGGLRIATTRIRWWLLGDRIKKVAVIETDAMGGAAVRNLGFWLIVPAISQFLGSDASRVVQSFGGRPLSITWAMLLACGVILVWAGHYTTALTGACLEIIGNAQLALAISTYAVVVIANADPPAPSALHVAITCGCALIALTAWRYARATGSRTAWVTAAVAVLAAELSASLMVSVGGTLFVLALCTSSAFNLLGRSVMLGLRMRVTYRLHRTLSTEAASGEVE